MIFICGIAYGPYLRRREGGKLILGKSIGDSEGPDALVSGYRVEPRIRAGAGCDPVSSSMLAARI